MMLWLSGPWLTLELAPKRKAQVPLRAGEGSATAELQSQPITGSGTSSAVKNMMSSTSTS